MQIAVALIVVAIALVALALFLKSKSGEDAESATPEPRLAAREAAPELEAKEPEAKEPEAKKAEEPAAPVQAEEEPEPAPLEAREPAQAQEEEEPEPAPLQAAAEELQAQPEAEEEEEDDADAIATLAAGGEPVEVPEEPEDDDPILAVARELQAAGELADAADAYESMLLDDPTSLKALEPLVELYTKLESWAELQRTLYMLADVIDDDKRRVGLMLRAAHVSEERLGDTDGARDRYEQILELDPASAIARERLESLNAG